MPKLNPTPPIQDLIDAYEDGATIRQIAKRFGGSFQNVNIRLKNAGVTMRAQSSNKRTLPDKACETCGRVFRPHSRNARFCKPTCVRHKRVCKRGHPLTEDNRFHFPSSNSRCKLCSQMRQRGEV